MHIFKGKIIISDSLELSRECYIKGITHILNTSPGFVPNEKIDCIVMKNKQSSQASSELEAKIIRAVLKIPILYLDNDDEGKHKIWCSLCNKNTPIDENHIINKYCSEKCMKKDSGFTEDFKPEATKDLDVIINKIPVSTGLTGPTGSYKLNKKSSAKSSDKFQTSMVKDAIRLDYAIKRVNYKKEMKQPGLKKSSTSSRKLSSVKKTSKEDQGNVRLCQSMTKKGQRCTNRAIGNSNYCGIISHMMSEKDKTTIKGL